MSFFGLPESQKYLGGVHEREDVAVYTWGEESYDGLGDALLEGGDDLNDETFGGTGPIGKDFDFQETLAENQYLLESYTSPSLSEQPRPTDKRADKGAPDANVSSLWDSKSPFSVLPRLNSGNRFNESSKSPQNNIASTTKLLPIQASATAQSRMRTVDEIEAEMRAAAIQQREQGSIPIPQDAQVEQPYSSKNPLTLEEVERQMRGYQISPQPSPQRVPPHPNAHRQTLPVPESQAHDILQTDLHPAQNSQMFQQLSLHERHPSNSNLSVDPATMQILQSRQRQSLHERQPSNPSLSDLRALQLLQAQQQQTIAAQALAERAFQQQQQQAVQQGRIPQSHTQAVNPSDFLPTHHRSQLLGMSVEQQEALRLKAAKQIQEQELLEAKRRRIAMKISRMSRNNDLMTQSDKDFITRIQVSQLMMSDPYEEDFYNQIFQTLVRKRMVVQNPEDASSTGARNETGRRGNRRQNAMQRMEAQVERIINNVRLREKEKDLHSLSHLQGVLGKTSGRSYKAAPRQLLQVSTNANLSAQGPTDIGLSSSLQALADTKSYDKKSSDHVPVSIHRGGHREALTKQEALIMLEKAYDILLQIEHLRREQPPGEDIDSTNIWMGRRDEKLKELLDALPIRVTEEVSVPHPLISMLHPNKGKRIIPRIVRQLDKAQQLELMLAIIKNISQLDVVANAYLLDGTEDTPLYKELEAQTQSFMNNVFNAFLPLLMELTFPPINHILTLLLERADLVQLALCRPGIALLTAVFTQVAHIKHAISLDSDRGLSPPLDNVNKWQHLYDRIFRLLNPHLLSLFPSYRMTQNLPFGTEHYLKPSPLTDTIDQPAWNFLATFAVHASLDQQQVLVTILRDKVLENVISASKGWNAEENARRLTNVNLFLNALGLDSSQIAL